MLAILGGALALVIGLAVLLLPLLLLVLLFVVSRGSIDGYQSRERGKQRRKEKRRREKYACWCYFCYEQRQY